MIKEIRKANVKRLLLRYVRDSQLKRGDRLPNQKELLARFDCGATTLTAAIRELCEEGILETKHKVGVYVLENTTAEKICRRIGIMTGRITGSPFQAFLNAYLESALSQRGSRAVWFHQRESAINKIYNSIDDIINLSCAI